MNYADIYSRRPIVTDFRALCTELVEAWNSYSYADAGDAADRMAEAVKAARAALAAAPEGEGPSESDVANLFYRHMGEGSEVGFENAIAEALARWGRFAAHALPLPAPQGGEVEA